MFWFVLLCPFVVGFVASLPPWGAARIALAILAAVNALMFPFWLGRVADWLEWDTLKSSVQSWSIWMLFGGFVVTFAVTALGYLLGRTCSRMVGGIAG